jgi:hypothetical protein
LRPRWPPSAAQTARAVFPHAAFTKSPFWVGAREGCLVGAGGEFRCDGRSADRLANFSLGAAGANAVGRSEAARGNALNFVTLLLELGKF